jgi:hypothetical protein
MKPRTSRSPARHSPEFKGVVKKITGKLTNRPELEQEGDAEMLGPRRETLRPPQSNPDPHRRG